MDPQENNVVDWYGQILTNLQNLHLLHLPINITTVTGPSLVAHCRLEQRKGISAHIYASQLLHHHCLLHLRNILVNNDQ